MERHEDDERRKHGSDDKSSRKKLEKRKSRGKRHREDSRRRQRRHSSDKSSASSSDRDRQKKETKKHGKKSERRKHKKRVKEERKKSKGHNKSDDNGEAAVSLLERNFQFVDALHALLELQPGMASELPIVLIRMADGASFDLSQMPDYRVSMRLQDVLASLSPFGVERDERTGSWMWKAPSGGGRNEDPLLLLKIARALLDQIGITIEAVENYGKQADPAPSESSIRNDKEIQKGEGGLSAMTALLLQQFDKEKESDAPSLAQELASLCNVILSGECVALDGVQDEALRAGIEQLFCVARLEKTEMEDSDSDDDKSGDEEPTMGYGLPDEDMSRATTNLKLILEVCKANDGKTKAERSVKGPALMPSKESATRHIDENDDDDDDDEEGPEPIGSEKAKRRVQKGPMLPPEVIRAMADGRKQELNGVVATGMEIPSRDVGEREQWMTEPGEHEFLQGIKSGKMPIKSRSFLNTKQSSTKEVAVAASIDPAVQAEMDAIMDLHRQARGPSLLEQHRLKKSEEKADAAGNAEWKWSRDKDLDAGRRVDKNHLNMIMGGAASNLKDKFQGGFHR